MKCLYDWTLEWLLCLELKLISKHASMVTTQVEQVLKAQNDLLNELNSKNNDYVVRVATRGGKVTQEPLYPEGHPKRIEQDSQRNWWGHDYLGYDKKYCIHSYLSGDF